jgi:cob(I)alamin adenosyltransferase
MVKINKIYTRTGDDGTTGLVGGDRVPKDSLKVESYGAVDELNAHLGMVRTLKESVDASSMMVKHLSYIQNVLFDIGSELATPAGVTYEGMICVDDAAVKLLEQWIDEYTENIPELRSFVLPGGSVVNAWLHTGRTVCRRAEREVIRLGREEKVSESIVKFLNRLSDLLFAMSRAEIYAEGKVEYLWKPGREFA